MNRKIVVLAVACVTALPVVASAASATLYGQIDVSLQKDRFESPSSGVGYSDPNGWYLQNNASRIGVRGEADPGVSSLQGIYQAEFGVDATDGSLFSQRDIFAGLQGDFGILKLGTMDTVLKTAQGGVDQFRDSVLDMKAVIPGENRDNNMIRYVSPAFLDNTLTLSASHEPSGDNPNKPYELGVSYSKDGLYLALATARHIANGSVSDTCPAPGCSVSGGLVLGNNSLGLGGVDTGGTSNYNGGPSATEMDATRVVARYETDSFNVGGLYEQSTDTVNTSLQDRSWLVGGAFIMDSLKFKMQYMQTRGAAADVTLRGYGAGVDYSMGRSTTVYALAGTIQTGNSPRDVMANTFAIGLRQKF